MVRDWALTGKPHVFWNITSALFTRTNTCQLSNRSCEGQSYSRCTRSRTICTYFTFDARRWLHTQTVELHFLGNIIMTKIKKKTKERRTKMWTRPTPLSHPINGRGSLRADWPSRGWQQVQAAAENMKPVSATSYLWLPDLSTSVRAVRHQETSMCRVPYLA